MAGEKTRQINHQYEVAMNWIKRRNSKSPGTSLVDCMAILLYTVTREALLWKRQLKLHDIVPLQRFDIENDDLAKHVAGHRDSRHMFDVSSIAFHLNLLETVASAFPQKVKDNISKLVNELASESTSYLAYEHDDLNEGGVESSLPIKQQSPTANAFRMLGRFQLKADAAREADYIDLVWKQQGVAKAAENFSYYEKFYPETQRLSQLRNALTSAGYPIPVSQYYNLGFLLWKHTREKNLHCVYMLCGYAVSVSPNVAELRDSFPFTEAVATLRSAGFVIPARFANQRGSIIPRQMPDMLFDRLQF